MHHAGFGTRHQQPVIGHGNPHRAQPVPVHRGHRPVTRNHGQRGRTIPRFHHRVAVPVEITQRLGCRGQHRLRHHHGLDHGQVTPALEHQLTHTVKRCTIGCTAFDHGLEVVNIIAKQLRFHAVFVAQHPVVVAAQGVDLTVMRQHPERLGQFPGRESVGGITLVIKRKPRHKAFIQQIRVEIGHLFSQEHALIDDRLG